MKSFLLFVGFAPLLFVSMNTAVLAQNVKMKDTLDPKCEAIEQRERKKCDSETLPQKKSDCLKKAGREALEEFSLSPDRGGGLKPKETRSCKSELYIKEKYGEECAKCEKGVSVISRLVAHDMNRVPCKHGERNDKNRYYCRDDVVDKKTKPKCSGSEFDQNCTAADSATTPVDKGENRHGIVSHYDTPGCGSFGLKGGRTEGCDRLKEYDVATPIAHNAPFRGQGGRWFGTEGGYLPNEILEMTVTNPETGVSQTYRVRNHDTCEGCAAAGNMVDVWGSAMRERIFRDTGVNFTRDGRIQVTLRRMR